eukprot:1891395-Amphidinium_carterae.1
MQHKGSGHAQVACVPMFEQHAQKFHNRDLLGCTIPHVTSPEVLCLLTKALRILTLRAPKWARLRQRQVLLEGVRACAERVRPPPAEVKSAKLQSQQKILQ